MAEKPKNIVFGGDLEKALAPIRKAINDIEAIGRRPHEVKDGEEKNNSHDSDDG